MPPEAREVVTAAVKAYMENSYTDKGPFEWTERLKPYATDGFIHSPREMFSDPVEIQFWRDEVVAKKRVVRMEVSSAEIDAMNPQTTSRLTFTVFATPHVSSVDGDHTGERTSLFVTVDRQRGGRWLVSDITGSDQRR